MGQLTRLSRRVRRYAGLGKLKRDASSYVDRPDELVSLIFGYCEGTFRPLQLEGELASLVQEVRELAPATVLEIGTARGGTLFLWTRLAQPDAVIASIDLPGGKFGGGYSPQRQLLYRRFRERTQKLLLLRDDSHASSTVEMVKHLLGARQVDFLFIDGDHTYDGVKRDWELYSPLVRHGGMVAFHDIASNYDDTQVKALWDSIKAGFRHKEIIADPGGLYGIGILYK